MFLKVRSFGPIETNSILFACSKTKKAAIVDAPPGCVADWVALIREQGFKPELLLLTHSHLDHIADANQLKKELNLFIWVHPADAPNLEKPGSDRLPLFFPAPGVHPDGLLTEGQKIAVGTLSLEVIHTPGHTPGGVSFYVPQEKILFSGDTLFKGTIGNISFPTSNPSQMWQSLKKLATLPPETRVIPGHGEETTIGAESWIDHAEEMFK